MLDLSTPVSPVVAIVETLDDSTKHILIDSNKTDVVYVEPYHIRNNTRAYINEYDTDEKANIIRNHREIHYDRVDLTQLIEDISVLAPDNNDQLCHVIHTPGTNQTVHNLDADAFCHLLNDEYDIPVLPTDFAGGTLERVKSKNTTMGEVYRTMNCIITDIEVTYSGGTITHFDETLGGVVSRPGFVFTREWNMGEAMSFLPNENLDKAGWSIVIGFNNDVEYTTATPTSLTLSQGSTGNLWYVNYEGQVVAQFDSAEESGVTLTINKDSLSVETIGSESTAITLDIPGFHYNRGVMRVLTYTTNPYASLFKLGFDVSTSEVVGTEGLTINDKDYAPVYNLVLSDPRSNAVVNDIAYPVSISPYKAINYGEKEPDKFKPLSDDKSGALSVFVKPEGFNDQNVTFLLSYDSDILPVDTVSSVLITITDIRNVNNKIYVKTIPLSSGKTLVGSGPSVNALVFKTLNYATVSELFSVTIAAGDIDVSEDELVLGKYVTAEQISGSEVTVYKVDIQVDVKSSKSLPNIDVIYTPSIASNE